MSAASSWDEANIGIAGAVRAIDARNDERESLKQANAYRWRELDAMNAVNQELRADNVRLQHQVDHFNRTHGDCGAELFDLREENAELRTRIQELEGGNE